MSKSSIVAWTCVWSRQDTASGNDQSFSPTAKAMRRAGPKKKACNTRYSQPVTHASTNRAQRCLTSVIGREPVFPTWYGRRQSLIGPSLPRLRLTWPGPRYQTTWLARTATQRASKTGSKQSAFMLPVADKKNTSTGMQFPTTNRARCSPCL